MVACSDLGSTQFVIFNTDTTLMFTAPCIVTSKKKKEQKEGGDGGGRCGRNGI